MQAENLVCLWGSCLPAMNWWLLFGMFGVGFIGIVWMHGWMGLLQILIMMAVSFWMIYVEATPSGLLIGAVGIGAAWLLTVAPLKIYDWLRAKSVGRSIDGEF